MNTRVRPVTKLSAWRYLAAGGSVALALLVSIQLRSFVEPNPFIFFFAAVALSAWYGGLRAGLLATVLSALAANYFFLDPAYTLWLEPGESLRLAVFMLVATLISALSEARARAETSAQAQREELRVTLASIGDAVIATDAAGRVTFLNAVAEELTGWRLADALGQPIEAIFQIINASTRERVEGPVARVLREGVVVGLANHTLLIARNGAERPIDDSGAPIRDAAGAVIGAVLVFRDISAQEHAAAAAATALAHTARLYAVSEALAGALTPEDVAAVMIEHGGAALGAAGGIVMLLAPGSADLEIIGAKGYPAALIETYKRMAVAEPTPLSDAVRERLPLLIESRSQAAQRYPGLAAVHPQIELHAWANLPLLLADRAVGALELSFDAPHAFDEEERAFLLALARQCAQALERARLYAAELQAHSAAERARARAAFLADAGRLLAGSLDYPTTLRHVSDLAVPQLADWCVVDMVGDNGALEMVAAVHVDPAKVEWAYRLRREHPVDPDAPAGAPSVIRSGQAELYPDIPDSLLEAVAHNQEELEILRAVGYRSIMVVPLRARGRMLGAITFVIAESARRYDADDLAFAQELADRAAIAIDNARLYTTMQQAHAEAEAAVQLRDMFLSVASHELKTPLTSLLMQAQLLQRRALRDGGLPERDQRALQVVADQARRLDRMINALLDISRLERGQLTIDRAPLDLDALARRVIAEIQPTSEPHTIVYDPPDAALLVNGDELRLEQVLQNLLQNAIKYSPRGGTVHVRLEARDHIACLSVADQGIGIPAEALPRLFTRFYRAANADPRQISGMGIGLYVVKEIIGLHDGTITVDSSEGQGSTFTICLQLASQADQAQPIGEEAEHDS